MLAEHLKQAAALELVLEGGSSIPSAPVELARAAIACAERLLLWGEAARVLRIVEGLAKLLPAIPELDEVRIRVLQLKALSTLQRDHECLEIARLELGRARSIQPSLEDDFAMIRILEGQALWHLNRVDDALAKLHQLRNELLSRPNGIAATACSVGIASALVFSGSWAAGRRYALEAWVLATRVGSRFYEGLSQQVICMAERSLCHWENSIEAGEASIQAYEEIDARLQAAFVRRSIAVAQWKQGNLGKSRDSIESTLPLLLETNHTWHVRYANLLLALIALHGGRADDAKSHLASTADPQGPISESRPELLRLEYLGDVELEQGNAAEALKRYDEVLPHALALIPRGDVVAELRRRRAECFIMLARAQDSYEEAKEALALCLELGDRYEEAATYRTLALAAAALGKHDEAKKHFEHGFAMYDDIETPYEWGKLWMSYGDWLCGPHAGAYESLDGAREAYRAACDHFERMGAELKLGHAKQRMAALAQRIQDEGVQEHPVGEKPRPRRRPSVDRELQRRVQWAHDTFGLVTRHRPLLEMLEQIATVAVSDIPVLVLGESGTGKELIARGVHALSGRTGRLVEVNCSAVPTTMMEAEFFGSVQGSFTGSTRDRAGLFEEAHEGSIFMDEIGEMPVDLQAKLLRFLETGEVRRIGATTGRTVDARLIAATNRDAAKLHTGEGFRRDLYYRLAHAVFTLPPLRSRGDDVALLVDHFLDSYSAEARKRVTLSRAARERLTSYSWPGNIRQLRALLQRLVVLTPDGVTVTPRDIPLAETGAEAPRSFLEEMEDQEKVRIVEALEKSQFIKADAARILRMSRTTLLGKMKRYRIPG